MLDDYRRARKLAMKQLQARCRSRSLPVSSRTRRHPERRGVPRRDPRRHHRDRYLAHRRHAHPRSSEQLLHELHAAARGDVGVRHEVERPHRLPARGGASAIPSLSTSSSSASTCRRATNASRSCATWGSPRSRRRSSAWCPCPPIPKPTASTRSSCASTAWLPSTASSFPRRARMRSSLRSRGARSMSPGQTTPCTTCAAPSTPSSWRSTSRAASAWA